MPPKISPESKYSSSSAQSSSHWLNDYLVPTPRLLTAQENDVFVYNMAKQPGRLKMYVIEKLSKGYGGNKIVKYSISLPVSFLINFGGEYKKHPQENAWQHLGRAAITTGVDLGLGLCLGSPNLYKAITAAAEVANHYWETHGGKEELYKFSAATLDPRFQEGITKHLPHSGNKEIQLYLATIHDHDFLAGLDEAMPMLEFWANAHKVRSGLIKGIGDFMFKRRKTPAITLVNDEMAMPVTDAIPSIDINSRSMPSYLVDSLRYNPFTTDGEGSNQRLFEQLNRVVTQNFQATAQIAETMFRQQSVIESIQAMLSRFSFDIQTGPNHVKVAVWFGEKYNMSPGEVFDGQRIILHHQNVWLNNYNKYLAWTKSFRDKLAEETEQLALLGKKQQEVLAARFGGAAEEYQINMAAINTEIQSRLSINTRLLNEAVELTSHRHDKHNHNKKIVSAKPWDDADYCQGYLFNSMVVWPTQLMVDLDNLGVQLGLNKFTIREIAEKIYVDAARSNLHTITDLERTINPSFEQSQRIFTALQANTILSLQEVVDLLGYELHRLKAFGTIDDGVSAQFDLLWKQFASLPTLTSDQTEAVRLMANSLLQFPAAYWPKFAVLNDQHPLNTVALQTLGERFLHEILIDKKFQLMENEQVIQVFDLCRQRLPEYGIYTDLIIARYADLQDWLSVARVCNDHYNFAEEVVDAPLHVKLHYAISQEMLAGDQTDLTQAMIRNACENTVTDEFSMSSNADLLKRYTLLLLLDEGTALDNIPTIKRCYELNRDSDDSEFWLRSLNNSYVLAVQFEDSAQLLTEWVVRHSEHPQSDELKLILAKMQCLTDQVDSAEKTFSSIKNKEVLPDLSLYQQFYQEAQAKARYSAMLIQKPIDVFNDLHAQVNNLNKKPPGVGSEMPADAGHSLDLDYSKKMFERATDSMMAFSIYIRNAFAANHDPEKISAAFRKFHTQQFKQLSDQDAIIYQQYLKIFNRQALLDAAFIVDVYRDLNARFDQALTDFKSTLDTGDSKAQYFQAARACMYLASLLDAGAPDAPIKVLSDMKIGQLATDLEVALNDPRLVLSTDVYSAHALTFLKLSIAAVKAEAGMRIAKFKMDGIETLQFLMPFIGRTLGVSPDWQYHIDSVLEVLSRNFQMQATLPQMKIEARGSYHEQIFTAGALRVLRNIVSGMAESLPHDQKQKRIEYIKVINIYSSLIFFHDAFPFISAEARSTMSRTQVMSVIHQLFTMLSGYFNQWEYAKSVEHNPARLTLFNSEWVYDLTRALSAAVSRNVVFNSVNHGYMVYNALHFLARALDKIAMTMPWKVVSECAFKEGLEAVAQKIALKIGYKIAEKSAAETGSKLAASTLPKFVSSVVSGVLIASLAYDICSILGFNWEAEQLQKIANFLKDGNYAAAKMALKEFDDSYWYSFHSGRTMVAERIYGTVLGATQKVEEYRTNKIAVLRELLAANIAFNEKDISVRNEQLKKTLKQILNFAKNANIFNHATADDYRLYSLFIASHYDVCREDNFALHIRITGLISFILLNMDKCSLSNECSSNAQTVISAISALKLSTEQEQKDYQAQLDGLNEFVIRSAAQDFTQNSVCATQGMSVKCEEDFQQYLDKRKATIIVNPEIERNLTAIDRLVVIYRIDNAFRTFLNEPCDLSEQCEQQFDKLSTLYTKHNPLINQHNLASDLLSKQDDARLHQINGTLISMQIVPCDLSQATNQRAELFRGRVHNAPIIDYERKSNATYQINAVSTRCYAQADDEYRKLLLTGQCVDNAKLCDNGLRSLRISLNALPFYNINQRSEFEKRLDDYTVSSLYQIFEAIKVKYERAEDPVPNFIHLREMAQTATELLELASPRLAQIHEWLAAGQNIILHDGLRKFLSEPTNLFNNANAAYQHYNQLRTLAGPISLNPASQQQYGEIIQCFDELVSIHQGRLDSLTSVFICPDADRYFVSERAKFFNMLADLILRFLQIGIPVTSVLFSRVEWLKSLAVKTDSRVYKRFNTLLLMAYEIFCYGNKYYLHSLYPNLAMTQQCQGYLQCGTAYFTEQSGLMRLVNLGMNWVMTEEVYTPLNINYLLVPLFLISSILMMQYGLTQTWSFFSLYILTSQLINLSSYALRYMQANYPDHEINKLGRFALRLITMQDNLIFNALGQLYLYCSIKSTLPSYSEALNFYRPIANVAETVLSTPTELLENIPIRSPIVFVLFKYMITAIGFVDEWLPYVGGVIALAYIAVKWRTPNKVEKLPTKYSELKFSKNTVKENQAFFLLGSGQQPSFGKTSSPTTINHETPSAAKTVPPLSNSHDNINAYIPASTTDRASSWAQRVINMTVSGFRNISIIPSSFFFKPTAPMLVDISTAAAHKVINAHPSQGN